VCKLKREIVLLLVVWLLLLECGCTFFKYPLHKFILIAEISSTALNPKRVVLFVTSEAFKGFTPLHIVFHSNAPTSPYSTVHNYVNGFLYMRYMRVKAEGSEGAIGI